MDKAFDQLNLVYPRSRLLLACPSCFRLKPPVIVELKTSSSCSWCSKENKDGKKLLLLESQLKDGDDNVEYVVIRRCSVESHESIKECKQFLGLKWKSCPNGETCKDAHGDIERRIWSLESQFGLPRNQLVKRLGNSVSKERKPLKGVFHCVVCSKNLPTGKEFSDHCDTTSHIKLMRTSHELNWKYRPLPETDTLVLCQSFVKNGDCENGDHCSKAHSNQEYKEWKRRRQLQNDKLKFASETGLMSFIDMIKHEYNTSSSYAKVLKDALPGVKVRIRGRLTQRIALTPGTFVWKLKIHCTDNTEKLNHAAFFTMRGSRGAFKICRSRGSKHSKPVGHLNFKVMLDDSYSLNLYDGDGSYEVRFKANTYGTYSTSLLLEFRNCPRPLLKIDFSVDVLDVHSPMELLASANRMRPVVHDDKISWERQREIIRWDEEAPNDYSKNLQKTARRYKDPSVALEYAVEKRENSTELFHPDRLDASNYVKEMHKFLYREEEAQTKLLDRPRCFSIVVTNSYMSSRSGISISPGNELFAIFELPKNLSRDTDEGLLILDSCLKVLIGRKHDPPSKPVYEALIIEKYIDHIIISFSEKCVQAWKLTSGETLETEIQFKLNREKFCLCHYALDQLQANQQLALVCPTNQTSLATIPMLNLNENSLNLDNEQKKVFAFLKSEIQRRPRETIPLFVVQGSFGTGKTYTICKCIEYLLKHDNSAKILICTHSNSAADLYILNNFDDVDQWQSKVLRIVYHGRRRNAIPPLVQRYCLSNGNQFCYPTAQNIATHQVFITTFETALSLGNLGTSLGGSFTHIFLDEVAQVMEPSAIIPLTLADSGTTKVVIAGDHKQMTEKIYSKGNALPVNDADFTLLSRMYKIYSPTHQHERKNHILSNYLVVLRNNYRCVAPILQLIQMLFYTEGLLIPCTKIQPLAGFNPIQFHDVEGQCDLNRFTGGYYNDAEASYIKDFIVDLLQKYPNDLDQSDIVVVASYRDQVDLIRAKMRAARHGRVKVEPVRNIQGLEYKIVILSCVHKREMKENTEGEKYGLLSDRNMLNTAFTRTKLGIIAVGHAVTLWSLGKCDIMWRKYIEICCQFKGMHPPKDAEYIAIESTMREFSSLNPYAKEFVPGVPAAKSLPTPTNRAHSPQISEHNSSVIEEDAQFDDANEELEETLPLRDDILDDIVRNIVGFNPEKLVIKVDPSGVEFATERIEQDETDQSVDEDTDGAGNRGFSLDHLNNLVTAYPNEYKRCTIHIKTWYSAVAVLHEPDHDFDSIHINTKRNLGRSFDQDVVVVHIEKKVVEKENPDEEERLIVYGKVVEIISRYRDPGERKFICVPDFFNPGLMCPIDKKITKFIIQGRKDMSETDLKVPICQLKKNKDGREIIQIIRHVKYDRFSMTMEKSKHFVVRFIKWLPNCAYPVGYVSEEIKPKNFELYYSLLHDVPSLTHKTSVDQEAVKLANQKLEGDRVELDSYVFTIDPEGSTDLDDAMSLDKCKQHKNCWKIGIHIADVASVIPADSDVDIEARKRATSFYSGNVSKDQERKVIHMLPSKLSSQKCSLRADGQKRPAISIFIHSTKLPVLTPLDEEERAELNLPTPQLTYITSSRQLTYKEAEDSLRRVRENGVQYITESNEENLDDQLFIIWKTMLKLRFRRQSWASYHGTPDFDGFDRFCDEASAHMLIEEAMITCNSCCSHFLHQKGCDFLLRTQNAPLSDESLIWREENEDSIKLSLFQQECMKQLHGSDKIREMENLPQKTKDIPIFPHVWMKIQRALHRNDVETALILFSCDTMQPALSPGHSGYFGIQSKAQLKSRTEVGRTSAPGCITHFSLRLPLYSWFSSPIRRYTDIHSQRMILEKISSAKTSTRQNSNVIEISQPKPINLTELSKKLMQRNDDAKKYEKDVKSFSYALSLSTRQNYEVANIREVDESGVLLNFVDLRDLPFLSSLLRYSDLKLHTQTDGNVSWKIRYFDAGSGQSSAADSNNFALHNFYTSTVVSSTEWSTLLRSAKAFAFDPDEPMSERAQELLKTNFERVLQSQKVIQVCNRTTRQRVGPCDNEDCRKKKICHDYLDGRSKLGIYHYRVITMPLALGTPLLVQLYCGVKRGICVPSVQLLTVAQDLDICTAHNRSPVETFAADVRPILKRQFGNMDEYINFWLPLLRMDGVYNAVKDNTNSTIIQNVSVHFDNAAGVRLQGSFCLSDAFKSDRLIRISIDDFVCIRVKCFNLEAGKGDMTKVSPHKSSFTWVLHARISSHKKEGRTSKYYFTACTSLVAEPKIPMAISLKGKNLKAVIELVQLGVSHRGLARSLRMATNSMVEDESEDEVRNQDLITSMCLSRVIVGSKSHCIYQVVRSVGMSTVPGMNYPLNEGQIYQIRRALTQKVSMIQGPPGTGKSFVGANLTYYFHQNNKDRNGSKKILYCGPSNKSVDVVAEYLLDSKLKILRVYGQTYEEEDFPNPLRPAKSGQETEKRPSKKVRSITLHHIIRNKGKQFAEALNEFDRKFASQQEISFKDYAEYKEVLVKAKLEEFKQHDVIICTCTASAILRDSLSSTKTKSQVKKAFKFAQCIIDECGMCSEPETLAPIVASGAEQVVLIGDHMQLQPIIQCRRAKDFGLDVSMFERRHKEAGMLTNQYRMDPGICSFPSQHFYEGKLTTDRSVIDREQRRRFRFVHPSDSDNTSVFCHVVGTEKVNFSLDRGGEFSYYNETEAGVVIRILMYFYRNKVPLSNIMVLSPYSAQVTTIRKQILAERSQLKDVHVGTVVTSQGSESDFVILSTVRSRPTAAIEDQANKHWRRKFIGFVSDPHQINVAITRAKSGLCIVGNQNLLEKDTETWAELLKVYRSRGSVVYFDDPTAPWNR